MSLVLSLDTTGEVGSVALATDSGVLEEKELHSSDGFAHLIFDEIVALLTRHGLTLADVDLFAASSGPGSFTGVRAGLTAVKGLAEAMGKKVAGVSNLLVLASFGSAPLRAVIIDARRGEVFAALYTSSLKVVAEETVTKLNHWLLQLPEGPIEFISHLALPERDGSFITRPPLGLAAAIGRLALAQLRSGLVQNPEDVDANYVRRSDAELFWNDPAAK